MAALPTLPGDIAGRRPIAGAADDVDDDPVAPCPHRRIMGAAQIDVAEDLEVPGLAPGGVVDLVDGAAWDRPGVVDQNVDAGGCLGQGVLRFRLAEVARMDRRLHAVAVIDLVPRGCEIGLAARGQVQAAPLGRQGLGDGPAETAGRAGDKNPLAGQFQFHPMCPSSRFRPIRTVNTGRVKPSALHRGGHGSITPRPA